jgi:hypothetical protein
MKKIAVALMTVGVIFFLTTAAQAGFLNPAENPGAAPFMCEFPDSQNTHVWEFDYDLEAPTLSMVEVVSSASLDNVVMSGETDEDPDFTVVKTIQNNSCYTWTSYILTLSGGAGATFVDGSASAGGNKLQTVNYLHAAAIEFKGANPVAPGELLTLSFDINVPTCGLFNFTLTQEPIPEPATIGLLSLGGLALFRKRRITY